MVTEIYCVTQRFWVLFMIHRLTVFRWLQFYTILKILCGKLVCRLIWQFSQFRLKKTKPTKTNKPVASFLQIIISANISKSEIFLFCNSIETAVGWNWVVIQCIITLISSLALVVLIIFQKYFTQFLNAVVLNVQVIKFIFVLIYLSQIFSSLLYLQNQFFIALCFTSCH